MAVIGGLVSSHDGWGKATSSFWSCLGSVGGVGEIDGKQGGWIRKGILVSRNLKISSLGEVRGRLGSS